MCLCVIYYLPDSSSGSLSLARSLSLSAVVLCNGVAVLVGHRHRRLWGLSAAFIFCLYPPISRPTVGIVASAAVVGCVQNGISLLHTV